MVNTSKINSISSGRLYYNLLKKERQGGYLGKTVQLIPHFTDPNVSGIPRIIFSFNIRW